MANKKKSIDINQIKNTVRYVIKYKFIIYLLFIIILYSYLIIKISELNQVNPLVQSTNNPTNQILVPKEVNQQVVNQLTKLKNNNVQVKTLFENSRTNPF